ncbi:SnoaL-like domain-containing protein [Actinacidiphila yanglinensis]|uniref:SnoaL-like domain-containing protein n=1 Tax=Actinacidiphila yanglinensis TaxID=310779 RepID=A0A1H6ECY6_9ACTN|nr:nuclear transport factor 2 family protein [Actinacidiphila yanglinensis]SEG94879.1 SnoaL-like domain-containing protein [Actinacidiphila yanglinensis]
MTPEQTLSLVRRYHEAWTTTKDFDTAAQFLAEDLKTDLPVNTYADKQEFAAAIRGFGEMASSVRVLSACAGPGEAAMVYDLELGPIGTLRIAEQFVVAEGRITSIRQVHDTATMRAAGFVPPLPQ